MSKIVAIQKESDGTISHYKLDNGSVVDQGIAIQMVKNRQIENYNVGKTRDGKEIIRSNPDGKESNNLENLPTF